MKFEAPDLDRLPDPRRRRLMLCLPSGIALASPLALIACGGGGDGEPDGAGSGTPDPDQAKAEALAATLPPASRSVQSAKVVLPAAVAAGLTQTRLVSANNVSQVGDNGNAGVVSIEGAPQMSYVFDGSGRLLLMSVVENGVRTTVDSRGTAEALLLLASEAGRHGPAIEIAMRRALADARFDGIVEPVRLAVEAAAGRNGIDPDDPALLDALKTATLALRGKSAQAPMSAARAKAQAVTVTPDGAESGITVIPTNDFNTVQLQNQFRRRTWVSIARTGSWDASGNYTALTPPEAMPGFGLDATAALSFDSLVTSVGDYVTQFYADLGWLGEYESSGAVWQPVKSAPIALPFAPDTATVAEYGARVVGIGAFDGGAFTAAEQTAWDDVLLKTMIEDVAKPFIRTVILPLISDKISGTFKAEFEQLSWQLVLNGIMDISSLAVAGTYFPATVAALKAGDAKSAFAGFLTEFFSSNTFQSLLALGLKSYTQASGKNLTPTVLDSQGKLIGVNLVAGDLSQFNVDKLKDALGKLARIIQLIKVGTLVGDYGAIVNDWAISSKLTQFTLKISKAKVSLSPTPLKVSPVAGTAGKGSVTAKVEGLDGGVTAENVWLQWKCTARYGDLFRVGGEGVNEFETLLTSPTHDYIPTGVEDDPANPDTITVTAFYRNPSTNDKIEMGSAKVTVEFKSEFTLNITPKGPVDLPTDIDLPVDGFFNEKLPATATVEWTWTHGGVGSLAEVAMPANAGHRIVNLKTGASDGSATVTLSAVVTVPASDPTGARVVKVKPVTATLKVKKGTRTLTFECAGGVFPCDAGCGVTDYTAFIVPRIAGALKYEGVFSEFGYGPCNRPITWNSEVGDGGGCSFPVTYHPRSQGAQAPAWAVWIGFGYPLSGPGKFVATITLPA